jgi:hypothetical protein
LGFEMMQGLSAKIRLTSQYVQKAIDWSSKIADGDYSRPMDQIYVEHTMVTTRGHPDEAMVGEFLASFQKMIMKVKTREDELKQQVKELTIRVDSTKVDEEVDELTRSSFFQNLRSAAQRVRRQRSD